MLPQILRASHHLSYDWLSLNDNITDMAVPMNVGIATGMPGLAEAIVWVKLYVTSQMLSVKTTS